MKVSSRKLWLTAAVMIGGVALTVAGKMSGDTLSELLLGALGLYVAGNSVAKFATKNQQSGE